MRPTIKLDTRQFDRALNAYARACKSKTIPEILNTKAYYVCLRAFKETYVADRADIEDDLDKRVWANSWKGGGIAPLSGVIVQKNTFKEEGRGFSPSRRADIKAHAEKVRKFINRRLATRTFMRAGWVPAIKAFAEKIGKAPRKSKFSKPKGGAKPTFAGAARQLVTFWNEALSKTTSRTDSLEKYAGTALASAMAAEAASMVEYVAKKMQQATNKFKA